MRASPEQIDDSPPLWEQWAAGFVIFMMTGALIAPVLAPDQAETPILRMVWLPVYAVTAGLIAFRFEKIIRAWPAWLILFGLIALAYVSKYWSIDPEVTSRRVIAMAINSAFAVYVGCVFRGAPLPRMLMNTCLVMAIGSLIMVFAFPRIGVHQMDNAGLWRGLWYEKNQMGLVMVVGAVSSAAVLAADHLAGNGRKPWVPLMAFGLTTLLVMATQSKTSLLCWLLGVGMIGFWWLLKQGGAAITIVAVWFAVVTSSLAAWLWNTDSAAILQALGKDPSLTGRTLIWEALMRRVAERPMTGYGFSAFWGVDSIPAREIRLETQWPVPSAHNGWIDLLVQLGWPGAIFVGAVMLVSAILVIVRLNGMGAREGYWSIAYLTVFTALSLSESVLLTHANLPWILMLAIMSRAMTYDPIPVRAPLARPAARAYQNRSRIASDYVNGRRPLRF
ncbi:O-antigen ligase family protein [Brevundimonas nasdae]|uniref:O-antigen ligase family protein n=1 Tax=Brevundimonas nasdae TaxID=172043 RepID=A0ABX8TPI9_9CAUL|nr:O-antigen ligase family protein [Brevundimonas nasdae]QYC11339.1 O-antigen ligase family protein [Brevundimonas nasdae]QYC14127.1 O-antigen ligase family protein [Brevundimonas nasdae]